MRIGFITSCLSFGGAEKILLWIASEFSNNGDEVFIIDLQSDVNNSSFARKVDARIRVIGAKAKGLKIIKRLFQIKNIKRILIHEKADVVIGFTTYPSFLASLAGKMAGIPSIVCERCDPSVELKNRLCRFYHRFINKATGAVFQTEEAKKYYSEELQKKSIVLPNPAFPSQYVYQHSQNKTFVTIGRFENNQKRYDLLIDAFNIFHEKHNDYCLRIYGDGTDKDFIINYIEKSDSSKFIHLCGYTSSPVEKMVENEAFVLSSDYEGIPNILLEAMSCGMPVISTDTSPGGARILIDNGTNGLLVPCGDSNALAKAMCAYADDVVLREQCSKNARKIINKFVPKRISLDWITYVNKITSNNQKK